MAKKDIIWSKLAKLQLKNILNFYVKRNGNAIYSLKLLSEIQELLETLSEAEQIGRLTSNKVFRVIAFKVYLIFYEINGSKIEIISFWDYRQNVENRKVK